MSQKKFIPFLFLAVVYLILTLFQLEGITDGLKALLIPFLAFSLLNSDKFKGKKSLCIALLFSWLGDVLLLFAAKNSLFFILGLIAFLIAHVTYIILFLNLKKTKFSFFNWSLVFILLYLFGFLYFLWNSLNELKLPVIVYALVISTMLYVVIQFHFSSTQNATKLMLFGAVFFVLSDSILAINKFYATIYISSFWIMSTYLIAQFLLVYGILIFNKTQKKDAKERLLF